MLTGPASSIHRARRLRRDMTLPEVILWTELRKRPQGLKFRRQHPAGDYVLDFYCASHRLAIEVDGEIHNRGDAPTHDARRDAWLSIRGVRVLHIPAAVILHDVAGAVSHIVATAVCHQPLHQPAAGPPPRAGEEQETS